MQLETITLFAAWLGILLGFGVGAVLGIFFHREDWLGGYSSWPRRMLRLGHISLFGIALMNLAFVFTVKSLNLQNIFFPSTLFVIAAITMPLCCFFSAFKPVARHFFFIPVSALILGSVWVIYWGFLR